MTRRFLLVALLVLPTASRADDKLLPAGRPIEQAIDHYLDAGLKEVQVPPAPPADDPALLRRLTLDLVGRVPTLAEQMEYADSHDPARRVQLVDRLMASPGFVRHQSQELYTLLAAEEKRGGKGSLRDYLQASLAENRPWDRVFRELLLPDDEKAKGSGDFLKARVKDLDRLTVDVSSLFFGVNISCAQCHDHPHVPEWTQDHFYGMKSFFARTFEAGGYVGEHDAGLVKYLPNKGKEKVAPVMFLTGKTVDAPNHREPTKEEKKQAQERMEKAKKEKKAPPPPGVSLRAKLVETALAPDQRDFFARAVVNRLWHRFYGRGLVMPLDQMTAANPPSHPKLLDWLARDLVTHNYDLRRLTRGLVLSQAYARGSRWDGDKAAPEDRFAVAAVRPLSPTQLAASLKVAATDPSTLPPAPAEREKRVEELERAAEKFAKLFPTVGDNFQVSATEALLFANSTELAKDLLEGPGTLPARLMQESQPEARAELAVRAVLGRPARPDEVQALTAYLRARPDRAEAAVQQIVWALLTSAEFRFNH